MSVSVKFILYLTLLHAALVAIAWYAFTDQPFLLLSIEAGVLLSAYLAYRLYRSLIAPLQLLSRGAAALADKDFSVKLVPTGNKDMDQLVEVYNAMIEQLRTERVTTRQKEAFLDKVVNSARLGVAVLDFDGNVTSMNEWLQDKVRSDVFNTAVFQPALHWRHRPIDAPQLLTGPGNRRYRVEEGTFQDRGFERRFLFIQDVTTELLDAEKQAYGKVIRMMAHEVNNSNGAIESVLQSLNDAAGEADPGLAALSQEYLPIVIRRSQNMTAFMRRFAEVIRLPEPNRRLVELNDLLRTTGELMQAQLRAVGIQLDYQLATQSVTVSADRALLEQVVINAVTNARESIGSDGRIVLTTTAQPVGFIVADNGPGLPPGLADQVFTPFFSAKPDGQGVGLTLSRDILEGHGATYGLTTDADGWTRLRVAFTD